MPRKTPRLDDASFSEQNPEITELRGSPSISPNRSRPAVIRRMLEEARPHIQRLREEAALVREDLSESVARDCDIISRVRSGSFAWVIDSERTFLYQLESVLWNRDAAGKSLDAAPHPTLFLADYSHRFVGRAGSFYQNVGGRLTLGLALLSYMAASFPGEGQGFFMISLPFHGRGAVRAVSSFELLGRAQKYCHFVDGHSAKLDLYDDMHGWTFRKVYHPGQPQLAA